MGRVVQPLLFVLARCTRNTLIRQLEWLKAENEMLRKRVDKQRIFLDPEENAPLIGEWPDCEDDPTDLETVVCRTRLGGLLKHYKRRAA